MDVEWIKYAMGGMAAVGTGMFAIVMRAVGKLETKTNGDRAEMWKKIEGDRAEIWKRIDQINDTRVTREDVTNLQRAIDGLSSEMRHVREDMTDMAGDMGQIKGKLER